MLARGVIPSDYLRIKTLLSCEHGYRQTDVDVMMPALLFACRMSRASTMQ
jgi:hypothetical protein